MLVHTKYTEQNHKKKCSTKPATTGMDPEDTMLSERSQIFKIYSHEMSRISKSIETEGRPVVAKV